MRLVNGFATLDVPSRSLKYAFSGATQVFGIAFDADQKVGLLVHHHLESLVDRVQRVHSQNAPRQIVESRDQLLSPGDLLALPGSEGLAEKRGELGCETALTAQTPPSSFCKVARNTFPSMARASG